MTQNNQNIEDIHNKINNIIHNEINKYVNEGFIYDGKIYNFEEGCYVILKNNSLKLNGYKYIQIRVLPKNSNSIYQCNLEFKIKYMYIPDNTNFYKIICDTLGGIHFINEYHYYTHSIDGVKKEINETIINMPNITKITCTKDKLYYLHDYRFYYNITIDNQKYKCIIDFNSFYDNLNNLNIKTQKDVIKYILDIN